MTDPAPLPWEPKVIDTAKQFEHGVEPKPVETDEVQIRSYTASFGSGLAILGMITRSNEKRVLYISAGYGARQLAAAGVTSQTWLRVAIDDFKLITSFEIIDEEDK